MDTVGFIMALEGGELKSVEQLVEGIQSLIDSGLTYRLQGSYGRLAERLIESGLCHRRGECEEYNA